MAISTDGETEASRSENGNVLLLFRNASGHRWNRAFECFLPAEKLSLRNPPITFVDGDHQSSGVAERLHFPLLGEMVVFDLVNEERSTGTKAALEFSSSL